MHYLINVLVEKGDMLTTLYTPYGGIEAYQSGITWNNFGW